MVALTSFVNKQKYLIYRQITHCHPQIHLPPLVVTTIFDCCWYGTRVLRIVELSFMKSEVGGLFNKRGQNGDLVDSSW